MFAVEVVGNDMLEKNAKKFKARMDWILKNKEELANLVSHLGSRR